MAARGAGGARTWSGSTTRATAAASPLRTTRPRPLASACQAPSGRRCRCREGAHGARRGPGAVGPVIDSASLSMCGFRRVSRRCSGAFAPQAPYRPRDATPRPDAQQWLPPKAQGTPSNEVGRNAAWRRRGPIGWRETARRPQAAFQFPAISPRFVSAGRQYQRAAAALHQPAGTPSHGRGAPKNKTTAR